MHPASALLQWLYLILYLKKSAGRCIEIYWPIAALVCKFISRKFTKLLAVQGVINAQIALRRHVKLTIKLVLVFACCNNAFTFSEVYLIL